MNARIILTILPVAALGLFLAGCGGESTDKAARLEDLKVQQAALAQQIQALQTEIEAENPAAVSVRAKEVAITKITPGQFNYFIQTQGVIEAEDNIQVSAKTMGVITKVYVTEGQLVSRGQTLAQIDNTVILASIEEVKSGLTLANTVFERQKNLWDQKIGTEIQFLQAKNNKEGLEKRLATLNEQLEMSKIKSPISGTVDEINIKAGENAAPGMPAFRVINTSDLKVSANVSEAYVSAVKKGDKVLVEVADLDKSFEAQVTFVGRNINTLSRTFPVEIALPNATDLRPNMSAVIRIIFKTVPDALSVPINVVQDVNGQKVVYIAEKSGNNTVASKRVVEVAGVYNNLAQIVSGLQAGDSVISFGYQGLNDGDFVKI